MELITWPAGSAIDPFKPFKDKREAEDQLQKLITGDFGLQMAASLAIHYGVHCGIRLNDEQLELVNRIRALSGKVRFEQPGNDQ